jgi:hypothetical protein
VSLADVLHVLGSLAVLGAGIAGLVRPESFAAWLGLAAKDETGIIEIRSAFGGLLTAFGLFALWVQDDLVYTALGAGFVGALIARWVDVASGRAQRRTWIGMFLAAGIAIALLFPR